MRIVPLSIKQANVLISRWHRHNKPTVGGLFACGAEKNGQLVGCGIVGRPVARCLCDGLTCEITRVATCNFKNANSFLYGALCRAAKALGYIRVITYTLVSESGESLRAAGFQEAGKVSADRTWNTHARIRANVGRPMQEKIRWEKIIQPLR